MRAPTFAARNFSCATGRPKIHKRPNASPLQNRPHALIERMAAPCRRGRPHHREPDDRCPETVGAGDLGLRRRPGADPLLAAEADRSNERQATPAGVDLRHRRERRDADAAAGRRRRAVRLHAVAEGVCGERRNRRASVDLRLRPQEHRAEPRIDVLEQRRRAARVRGGRQLRLCARSRHRQACRELRYERPHRSPREPRARAIDAGCPADVAGGDLQGPDDRWRPRRRGTADVARRRARVRRAHRRFEMVLPHHPASGRARLRDLAEAGLGVQRRRQQLARDGGRRADGDRLRAYGFGGVRLLRRRSSRRQPLRQLADRARREQRQARVALSVRPARHLGSRSAVAAESRHGPEKRQDHRRRRAGDQAGAAVSLQSRHGRAPLSHRVPEVSAEQRARRRNESRTAGCPEARAVLAAAID